MKILDKSIFCGANIYLNRSVVCMRVALGCNHDVTTKQVGEEFIESLIRYLPRFETIAFCGERKGENARKLREGSGMLMPDLIWRIAVELQLNVGMSVCFGTFEPTGTDHVYDIVYEFQDPLYGEKAGPLAVALVQSLLPPTHRDTDSPVLDFDFVNTRNPLRKWQHQRRIGLNTRCIIDAAIGKNIPCSRIDSKVAQLGQGKHRRLIRYATTDLLSHISFIMTEDKVMTARILDGLGIPVPKQAVVTTAAAASREARRIGFPVVVKPRDSFTGLGVTTNIDTPHEVEKAFDEANKYSKGVIVETFINGDDHRLLVVNSAMIAAVRRIPAHVVGDGIRTIAELIEITNSKRHGYGRRPKYDMKADCVSNTHLSRQGYTFNDVPPQGEVVYLRSASNYSEGGICVDVTDEVHPDNMELAVRACTALGMDIAGVDLISPDITKSYKETGAAICEVGSRPGLLLHTEPDEGMPRDVGGPIVEMLYPHGSDARIPIACITGTRQKQVVGRMLTHLLSVSGHSVGLALQPDIFIDGVSTGIRNVSAPKAAKLVLNDPAIDAAVFEVSLSAIATSGIGFDSCTALAITNIIDAGDRPERENKGEFYKKLLDAFMHASSKPVILNADDPWSCELIGNSSPERLFLVSLNGNNPLIVKHVESGGHALSCKDEAEGKSLVLNNAGDEVVLIPAKSIRSADNRNATDQSLLSAALATALALQMGANYEDLRKGLATLNAEDPVQVRFIKKYPFEIIVANGINPVAADRTLAYLHQGNVAGNNILVIGRKSYEVISKRGHCLKDINASVKTLVFSGGLVDMSACLIEKKQAANLYESTLQAFSLAKPSDRVIFFSDSYHKTIALLEDVGICSPLWAAAMEDPAKHPINEGVDSPGSLTRYSSGREERLWQAEELAAAVNGKWINHPGDKWYASGVTYFHWNIEPGDLVITSNKRQWPKKYADLENRIPELFELGAAAAIVSKLPADLDMGKKYPLLVVNDTRTALDHLGRAAVDRLSGKVIAITGSVGKSTTTTLLGYLLALQGKTHATIKNFNSTSGAPLTAARTPRDCRYAVYECGIGMSHRANYLRAKMLRPDVVIITTIEPDHLEFYATLEGIVEAKTDLMQGMKPGGTAVLNRDAKLFELQQKLAREKGAERVITFGVHAGADFRIGNVKLSAMGSSADITVFGEKVELHVPHPGRHMIANAVAALAGAYASGADWRKAVKNLKAAPKMHGRAEVYRVSFAGGEYTLIDDAYSANSASIGSALEILSLLEPGAGGKRILVLGEIKELGGESRQIHIDLIKPIQESKVDRIYTLGEGIEPLWDILPDRIKGKHDVTAAGIIDALHRELTDGDIVLVKGSARSPGAMKEILTGLKGNKGERKEIHEESANKTALETKGRQQPGQVSVIFLGDTCFGESYHARLAAKSGVNILQTRAYADFLANFKEMLARPELVVANLETPLTDLEVSPLAGMKDYLHWGDIKRTTEALKSCNIRLVSLANNHAIDFGQEGLLQTLDELKGSGIKYVGAGIDLEEANLAYCHNLGASRTPTQIVVAAGFEYRKYYDDVFKYYAKEKSGGVKCWTAESVTRQFEDLRKVHRDAFVVAYPHWGNNYSSTTDIQRQLACSMIDAGADLVLGHGSHMNQGIENYRGRWIVYSLGNFVFNTPGRYQKLGVDPFSMIAELVFSEIDNYQQTTLRLYPIFTDNKATDYQSRFVDEREFQKTLETLLEASPPNTRLREHLAAGEAGGQQYLSLAITHRPFGVAR